MIFGYGSSTTEIGCDIFEVNMVQPKSQLTLFWTFSWHKFLNVRISAIFQKVRLSTVPPIDVSVSVSAFQVMILTKGLEWPEFEEPGITKSSWAFEVFRSVSNQERLTGNVDIWWIVGDGGVPELNTTAESSGFLHVFVLKKNHPFRCCSCCQACWKNTKYGRAAIFGFLSWLTGGGQKKRRHLRNMLQHREHFDLQISSYSNHENEWSWINIIDVCPQKHHWLKTLENCQGRRWCWSDAARTWHVRRIHRILTSIVANTVNISMY